MIKAVARKLEKLLLGTTPYQLVTRSLPPTLELVQLALAYYLQSDGKGVFVQIGASDGRSGDPVHHLLKRSDLPAILVEPIPSTFERLAESYHGAQHVALVNAAVADRDGPVTIYRVREGGRWEDPSWAAQVASFDREHLIGQGIRPEEIEETTVRGLTLSSLLGEAGDPVMDFLQVDTEGYDATVVGMALRLRQAPSFIYFEHIHLTGREKLEVYPRLEAGGYRWANDRFNTLAVHDRVIRAWWR